MKIAILSDIHGNHVALNAVSRELKENNVEKLIILGDFVGYYYNPEKVLEILSDWDSIMIRGNHEENLKKALEINDRKMINKMYGFGMVMAIDKLSNEQKNFLINLPFRKKINLNGLNLSLYHASPQKIDEYIYPDTPPSRLNGIFNDDDDFVFIGHSHYPFIYTKDKQTLVNVGSVGQSRVKGSVANWVLMDTKTKSVEIMETHFDSFVINQELKKIDSKYKYLQKISHRNLYSNVLVTGCGGDIGQSIGKIIRNEKCAQNIIGCDINNFHPGKFIFNYCEVIPRVDSVNYISELKKLINKYQIELIIPTSEPELRFFTENNINSIDGVTLLMSDFESRAIGFDKYKTYQFLRDNNLPHPWTMLGNEEPVEFPCILKSRTGKGSKEIQMIFEIKEEYSEDFIFQEFLSSEEQEFTCGVYRSNQGEINTIIIRRTLLGGYTNYGEVESNNNINNLLHSMAKKLKLKGGINVQLRLKNNEPYVFEINPRFSSTILFRHMLDFKDLLWQMKELKNIKLDDFTHINSGKIYKGYQEYISNDSKNIIMNNISFEIYENENSK